MVDIPVNITVSGLPTVEKALESLRQEVATLLRQAADAERDGRVAIRLREVALAVSARLSHAEAVERLKTAPTTGLPGQSGRAKASPPTAPTAAPGSSSAVPGPIPGPPKVGA